MSIRSGEYTPLLWYFALRSQSVRVDQHPAVALLFQPPVCEVLREPTRGSFRRKILDAGAIDDGDAEVRLDCVQDAADSIRMETPHSLVHHRVHFTRDMNIVNILMLCLDRIDYGEARAPQGLYFIVSAIGLRISFKAFLRGSH
jgi:hypothetical protein